MGARAFLKRAFRYFTESTAGTTSQLTAEGNGLDQSVCIAPKGYGVVLIGQGGFSTSAECRFAVGLGAGGRLSAPGEVAFTIGSYQGALIDQHGSWHGQMRTDNATPTVLTINGEPDTSPEAWQFSPQAGDIYYIRAKFCAAAADGSGKAFVTEIKWAVTYLDGTLTQLGATNTSFSVATPGLTWTVAPYVANGKISATVTGEAGLSVHWSAEFQYNLLQVAE